jgi:Putative beta barrel porin-7 (BBP7)
MRQTLLVALIIWAVGVTAFAADETPVPNILTPVSRPVIGRGAAPDSNSSALPPAQPLQPFFPTAPAVKTVAGQAVAGPTATPAPASVQPTVVTEPGGCNTCGDDVGRFFGGVEYALFWMRRNTVPPLVQVLPANLANFEANGNNLPPGAAATVFGADGINGGDFNGVRVYGGAYFDDAKCWGVDGSYLQTFQKTDSFAIASPGIPVIGRGFINTEAAESAFLRYTTPDGGSTGFIRVDAPLQMYTFDANLRAQGPSMLSDRVDYLSGFRYFNLRDSVTIDSGVNIDNFSNGMPLAVFSHEQFKASNEFYGSQVGLQTHYRYGCFSMDLTGKFAVGWVHQQVQIDGFSTTQLGASPPQAFPNQSILYVQPTNAGNYSRDHIAIMPEFMAQFSYQFTPHLKATIGYDLFTLSSVERSGEAIDPFINPSNTKYIVTQTASTLRQPSFAFSGTDYWANGLTAGLAFTY